MGSYRRPAGRTRLLAAGAAPAATLFTTFIVVASRRDAGKVLPESDAGFFRNPGGVGIYRLEKILDFRLNINIHPHTMDVRTTWWGGPQ
jgi:hypothetical protein